MRHSGASNLSLRRAIAIHADHMVPQPGGNYLGRTRAALKMPDGPHHALGEAVYLGTALADLADHDKRLSGIPIDTLNAQPPIIGPMEPMPA